MPPRGSSKKAVTLDADTRICVLHGPDEMQKRLYLQQLTEALGKAHGEVEAFTFDGRSAALSDVLDELRSFSLMQTYKLVIVDDADQFVKDHRPALERYADEPVEHATLVLRAGTWNKGNLDKKIEKVGAVVKCDAPSANQAQRWAVQRAQKTYSARLDNDAAAALVDQLGSDLMQLDSELGKLALMVDAGKPIDADLVRRTVGQSNEEKVYVMQEAVLEGLRRGSAEPMLRKLHELIHLGGQPDVLVAYFVADMVRKLNVGLMLRKAGVPQGELCKQLKIFPPRREPFMQVLGRLEQGRAARLFDDVVAADAGAKSGYGESMRNVEAFCVRLADEMK